MKIGRWIVSLFSRRHPPAVKAPALSEEERQLMHDERVQAIENARERDLRLSALEYRVRLAAQQHRHVGD